MCTLCQIKGIPYLEELIQETNFKPRVYTCQHKEKVNTMIRFRLESERLMEERFGSLSQSEQSTYGITSI